MPVSPYARWLFNRHAWGWFARSFIEMQASAYIAIAAWKFHFQLKAGRGVHCMQHTFDSTGSLALGPTGIRANRIKHLQFDI